MTTPRLNANKSDPYEVRDDLSKIRETLAVQNQVLSNIVQNQERSVQTLAQQSAQLTTVCTDVAILKSEVPKFQTELAALVAWKTEALSLFIPRREHEALHHEERLAELEEWRRREQANKVTEQATKAAEQRTLFQWAADHALSILTFILMFGLTLFSIFFHP